MSDKISLDSPRWKALKTFGGNAADLPKLIMQVRQERKFDNGSAFSRLFERIYQQYSPSQAAYAVVPHLAEIGTELVNMQLDEPWHSIGLIAATHDIQRDKVPADLVEPFRSSLELALRRCIGVLLQKQADPTAIYELSVAALGLSHHPLGQLVMDEYNPVGKAETSAICPHCGSEVQVAVFETALVVENPQSNGYPQPPASEAPLAEPEGPQGVPDASNPWAPIGAVLRRFAQQRSGDLGPIRSHLLVAAAIAERGVDRTTPAGPVFSLLGALLAWKEHPQAARRYWRAWDVVRCTDCGAGFVLADAWWGLRAP